MKLMLSNTGGLLALIGLGWLGGITLAPAGGGLLTSKHNLSARGSGLVRAASETEVCIFCHTPHGGSTEGPLWNRSASGASYTVYSSPTLNAVVGQPTGSSRLCLSCHDGTVALGSVHSRSIPIPMRDGITTLPAGAANLGTDLANDHPISFKYDATLASVNGKLKLPSALDPKVRLDANEMLQCTTCHDPHNDAFGKFLVKDNTVGALCLECHVQNGWASSVHALATAPVAPGAATVQEMACAACHATHAAPGGARLLTGIDEPASCRTCHNGSVAAKNVMADFNKFSIHPIQFNSSAHAANEDPINSTRHVQCADCHDSHLVRSTTAVAPFASGALNGVRGVNAAGSVVKPVQFEYEVCFRCHADSTQRGSATVTRQHVQTNTRLEFSPANPSYHPVVAAGKNGTSPSLIPPWTVTSRMYCTDCHNSDQSPAAGGTGANGPHGSQFAPLLERQLVVADGNAENSGTYALCYKCHSRTVVTGELATSWKYHKKHVVEERTACTTCHDPHGVVQNAHLINFNTTYVTPNGGVISFNNGSVGNRSCTLTCHGKAHDTSMSY